MILVYFAALFLFCGKGGKDMKKLRVVFLRNGVSKNSGKTWHRIVLRGKDSQNLSVLNEYWVSDRVAEMIVDEGIEEDMDVNVTMALDDSLRPVISGIYRADQAVDQSGNKEVYDF